VSGLKPCPVCGCSDPELSRDINGTDLYECSRCGFVCSVNHWGQLPRTNWVSTDERLPEDEAIVVAAAGRKIYDAMFFAASESWQVKGAKFIIPTGKDQ